MGKEASYYRKIAQTYAKAWIKDALDVDQKNVHYKLEYDKPNTWSLKYNLMWQRILKNLKVFPDDVFADEEAYYQTKMNKYGIPLDVRADFTKGDWQSWVAAMSDNEDDVQAIFDALYRFADESPNREPLSD